MTTGRTPFPLIHSLMARLTCTTTWSNVGRRLGSRPCRLTKKGWDSTRFVDSERHGLEEKGVRKTSIISGWDTNPRRCPNSTPAWSSSWTVALKKQRKSVSVSPFHQLKSLQLLQVLQEMAKNWSSN